MKPSFSVAFICRHLRFFLLSQIFFLAACRPTAKSNQASLPDYAPQALQGMIGGKAWTAKGGVAYLKADSGEPLLYFTDGSVNDSICETDTLADPETTNTVFIGGFKFDVGEYQPPAASSQLYAQNGLPISGNGIKLRLDNVVNGDNKVPGRVTGSLVFHVNDDNSINGNFTLSLCASSPGA